MSRNTSAANTHEGMARILTEVGFSVVGQARNGADLVELVRRAPPDVVIADLPHR